MSEPSRIHLVVPCYRESARIGSFLPDLCREMTTLGGVQVMVVEDGSDADEVARMQRIIEECQARYECLAPLLELVNNQGKGGAVYAGWAHAFTNTTWLAFVDADGSISPSEVARLITFVRQFPPLSSSSSPQLSNFNFPLSAFPPSPPNSHPPSPISGAPAPTFPALFASRVKMLGRSVHREFKRHLIGRIYATLVSETLRIPVYDSQCGLKIIPRSAYESIKSRLTINGFAFDVDLLVQLIDHGTPVIEIPIDWHEEPGGKVHLLRDSWRMAKDVLHIHHHRPTP